MAEVQLFQKYKEVASLAPQPISIAHNPERFEDAFNNIVKDEEGKKWLDATLNFLKKNMPNGAAVMSAPKTAAAWQQKAGMSGAYAGFICYSLSGWSHGIKKSFKGSFCGVSFPAGSLTGEVYFNSVNDLKGDCEIYCETVGPYYAIQFWQGGNYIAVWHCFNLSIPLVGAGGGTVTWYDD
ncbi:hypothetical protein N7478_011815 [Penicillium angulare]|uniref:uncharacterized protein n=1 Tax=Penicillium angulare TaxID=116970 RepID=UPI002540493F|nr:uncharacterized protein N7478_011815 [Penicillium angulare]KAJ5261220.1 hypothetical protein N7478_011815 [Penicillium angulare]